MSRFEWVLGGGLAALLVVAALAVLRFWETDTPGTAIDTAAEASSTARSNYEVAAPVAAQWSGDARLLTARATWQPSNDFQPEAASWDFVFYSPARSATALVSVVEESATLITTRETKQTLSPSDLDHWNVDSPEVVHKLLARGGVQFLQEMGSATLVLTLNTEEGPSWTGTLINTQAGRTLSLAMDAGTGEVLENPQVQ